MLTRLFHASQQRSLRLLTNTEIMQIDQTATASRQVLDGDLVVCTAELRGNEHALAAFDLGEKAWQSIVLYRILVGRRDHTWWKTPGPESA